MFTNSNGDIFTEGELFLFEITVGNHYKDRYEQLVSKQVSSKTLSMKTGTKIVKKNKEFQTVMYCELIEAPSSYINSYCTSI